MKKTLVTQRYSLEPLLLLLPPSLVQLYGFLIRGPTAPTPYFYFFLFFSFCCSFLLFNFYILYISLFSHLNSSFFLSLAYIPSFTLFKIFLPFLYKLFLLCSYFFILYIYFLFFFSSNRLKSHSSELLPLPCSLSLFYP